MAPNVVVVELERERDGVCRFTWGLMVVVSGLTKSSSLSKALKLSFDGCLAVLVRRPTLGIRGNHIVGP